VNRTPPTSLSTNVHYEKMMEMFNNKGHFCVNIPELQSALQEALKVNPPTPSSKHVSSACKSWLCSHTTFCGTVLIRTSSVVTVSLNKGLKTLLTDSRPYSTRWWVTTNIHFTNKTGRRQLLGRWLIIYQDSWPDKVSAD